MKNKLRIGTRGSALALVQARMVADALRTAYPHVAVEIVEIKSSGDWTPAQGETRLSEQAGGKGLFVKEIEEALIAGRIDCGVHSLKDVPTFLPPGLAVDHVLPRADARDAFLSNGPRTLADLPPGAVVGTSSLRRQAFILARRPDLKVVTFRGNVPTRIEKLRAGQVDATLLALAGLTRLGLAQEAASIIEMDEMLPACGQGIVGIETRADDAETRRILQALHCRITGYRAAAERAALTALNGSCHTPIGAHAVMDGDVLILDVAVPSADGRQMFRDKISGSVTNDAAAGALGATLGGKLKGVLPQGFLE